MYWESQRGHLRISGTHARTRPSRSGCVCGRPAPFPAKYKTALAKMMAVRTTRPPGPTSPLPCSTLKAIPPAGERSRSAGVRPPAAATFLTLTAKIAEVPSISFGLPGTHNLLP